MQNIVMFAGLMAPLRWATRNSAGTRTAIQHNIVFSGPTDAGKTWLVCALGKQACKSGYRVKYYRMPELLEDFHLQESTIEGHRKIVNTIHRYNLLIIDEWMSSTLNAGKSLLCLS